MNKQRRKQLNEVISLLEDAMYSLQSLSEEEMEAYDNLPDGIKDSEKGEALYENADTMETASNDIQDIIDTLNELL